jgi:hypothetical protein
MLNRLRLVREVDTIRQAVPADSFRSAAVVEAQLRAAVLKKTLDQMSQGKAGGEGQAQAQAQAQAQQPHHPHHHPHHPQHHAAPAGFSRVPPARPMMSSTSSGSGSASSPVSAAAAAAAAAAPPPAPPLPFVYRRAARDVQITDPSSGDLLQLDRGSWVLTAAAPHPATHLLPVYTVDPKTGLVVTYDIPVPGNHLPHIFDLHTLNMIETFSDPAPPAATATAAAPAASGGMVLPEGYFDYERRGASGSS